MRFQAWARKRLVEVSGLLVMQVEALQNDVS